MKNNIKIIWLFVFALLITSCAINGVKGNGNVITKTRNINSDFNSIDVSRGLDVYLNTGDKVSLEIEADENLHNLITTEVHGGTLFISAEENIYSAKSRKIHVSIPEIIEIKATSGSDVYSENTITGDHLEIKSTSGADIKLRLNVKELKAEATSGADIILKGKALSFNATATSGSDIKAYDLIVVDCVARATSGADIKVNVTGKLNARANSAGDVKYKGNPQIIDKSESSAGDVKKISD